MKHTVNRSAAPLFAFVLRWHDAFVEQLPPDFVLGQAYRYPFKYLNNYSCLLLVNDKLAISGVWARLYAGNIVVTKFRVIAEQLFIFFDFTHFAQSHALFHRFMEKNCHALGESELQNEEFEKISKIRLERLDSGFSIHGMVPLTLYLGGLDRDVAASILSGELKVFTYMHLPSFIEQAEQMGLPVTRPRSQNQTEINKATFSWEGRDIVFGGTARLVNTNYAEMCFGFDTPKSMLGKIKLSVEDVHEIVAGQKPIDQK